MTFDAPDLEEEGPDEESESDQAGPSNAYTDTKKFDDGPAHDLVPRREAELKRRDEALRLRLGGYSYAQIAEAMDLNPTTVSNIITRALSAAPNEKAVEQRAIENARLDRLQAAVWPEALKGDLKSVDAVLRISRRRAEMNGLDAPKRIDLRASVKHDVSAAVQELHQVILGDILGEDVVDAVIVPDGDDEVAELGQVADIDPGILTRESPVYDLPEAADG